jgi:hypothetical protein
VDLAYAIRVHDCSIEVIIFRHGPVGIIAQVLYDDRNGWPDSCKPRAYPRIADKSQLEKVWRCKNVATPPAAHMNYFLPPGHFPQSIIIWSNEIEYA